MSGLKISRKIRTIVESKDTSLCVDRSTKFYEGFESQWWNIKWTLAKEPFPEGSQLIKENCYAYVIKGNDSWRTPSTALIYYVEDNEINITHLKVWQAEHAVEEGE